MSSLAQRRQNGDSSSFITSRPTSAPELGSSLTATSLSNDLRSARLQKASEENKENDKENENRSTTVTSGGSSSGTTTSNSSSTQATQAVIQRRRRQKRRSTGLVHVDMEDIDPERQDSPVDGEEKEVSVSFLFIFLLKAMILFPVY
ncbi:hypothetical protein RP20_CCG011702 [Aedes albopictus]|nr:hypothetical protein RP20_CCG011702 [Aedes albopictus]